MKVGVAVDDFVLMVIGAEHSTYWYGVQVAIIPFSDKLLPIGGISP